MGGGSWTVNAYSARATMKADAGISTFAHSDAMHAAPPKDRKAHDELNPFGVVNRESRDSAEHPTSLAIAVLFDVTGSMRDIPVTCQQKLPGLLGLLLRKGYVEHPQVLFGAIGDATCDSVPLQVGQFESDNRMDENLENVFLEGGGGGQDTESYELAAYFMARHTSIDCYEKRGQRGYLFIIGDERAYPAVSKAQVDKYIGDGLQANVSTEEIFAELQTKYEVYFILPNAASHGHDRSIIDFWRNLFGQNFIQLADQNNVAETIALTIGLAEGTTDLVAGAADLKDFGASEKAVTIVTSALASVGVASRATGTALPTTDPITRL